MPEGIFPFARSKASANQRHAPRDEACKLIGDSSLAEIRLQDCAETHATACGIAAQIVEQLKTGHNNTEAMLTRACTAGRSNWRCLAALDLAHRKERRLPAGPIGDFSLIR
jgi:hypothetical protein